MPLFERDKGREAIVDGDSGLRKNTSYFTNGLCRSPTNLNVQQCTEISVLYLIPSAE